MATAMAPIQGLDSTTEATALLLREARYLDKRDWDNWLDLYHEKAQFWIPMWDSEYDLTDDPNTQMSLMFYRDRSGLEDRVFRIRTGASSSSTPLPRTCHLVTNIEVDPEGRGGAEGLQVLANFHTDSYRFKRTLTFFGSYEYLLTPNDAGVLRIASKKVVVANDIIHDILDFYSV